MLVVPVLVGVAAVDLSMRVVARPSQHWAFWTWMASLMVISIVVSTGSHRVLRRLAPLAVLFKMSLVFPDKAPSRFRTVLRSGTTHKLAERLSGSEQVAAENLIALLTKLGRHDRLTRGHAERVRAYSVMLGEQIGLSRSDLDKLNWAALIHDIGKLDVPQALLTKPGQPTDEEWDVLRAHPAAGDRYIEPLRDWLGDWALAATQHHERYDGRGYPLGLAGDNISLAGRIVAIADAYDVMTAPRSYKKSLPAAQARAELTRNSGTQFDPHFVRSFLEISVGRMRAVPGALGWLAALPDMIRVPVTTMLSTASGVVASAGITAAAVAAVTAIPDYPALAIAPAAVVIAEVTTPTSRPLTTDAVVATFVNPAAPAPPSPAIPTAPTVQDSTDDLTAPPTATSQAPPTSVMPTLQPATTMPTSTTPAPFTTSPPRAPAVTLPAVTVPAGTVPAVTLPAVTVPAVTLPAVTVPAPPLLSLSNDLAITRTTKSVTIHVLQNDSFGNSEVDASTLEIIASPTLGTAKVAGENISYKAFGTPGIDSLTYRVCSVAGTCQQATVTITIFP